jgi:hypothetical protein
MARKTRVFALEGIAGPFGAGLFQVPVRGIDWRVRLLRRR